MAIILTDKQVVALLKKELAAKNYVTRVEFETLQANVSNLQNAVGEMVNSISSLGNELADTTENANIARQECFELGESLSNITKLLEPINLNKLDADTIDGMHVRLVSEEVFLEEQSLALAEGREYPPSDTILIIKD